MAATAWSVYDNFQTQLGVGSINLSTDAFDMHLFRGSSNAATSALNNYGSLTSEVSNSNNYLQSGKVWTTNTWTSVATGQMQFDGDDLIWTASGGIISAIRFAVIVHRTATSAKDATNILICRTTLSASNFSLADASTLTVQINASGVFRMSSAD